MRSNLAPIALFVYARPEHTLRTLNGIKGAELSDQSILYIFADGPNKNADEDTLKRIAETRALVKSEQWCKEVHVIELTENKGIGDNITTGVTQICKEYGRVIVLEDDLEISIGFLRYMNEALELYKNDKEVKHVTGYLYPIENNLPSTFFFSAMFCWGWGTWDRAWAEFVNDANYLYNEMEKLHFPSDYNIHPQNTFVSLLEGNVDATGPYNWDINWLTTIYLNKGLCLMPNKSLVRNIGHDGTGLHCGINENLQNQPIADFVRVVRIKKQLSANAYNLIWKYYDRQQYSYKNRIIRRLHNMIGKSY